MPVIRQQERDEVARRVEEHVSDPRFAPVAETELKLYACSVIDQLIDEIRERFLTWKGLSALGCVTFTAEGAGRLLGNTEVQEWFAQAFALRADEDRENIKVTFYNFDSDLNGKLRDDSAKANSIDISVELLKP